MLACCHRLDGIMFVESQHATACEINNSARDVAFRVIPLGRVQLYARTIFIVSVEPYNIV